MKVSIIGSGIVGEIAGRGFMKLGYEVMMEELDKPIFRTDLKNRGANKIRIELHAFISLARAYYKPKLLKAVDDINEKMREKYGVRE